jgi:3-polyprenyl-4-hydroxybenzoate decarboxylase
MATRWQPHPASLIIPQSNTFMVDPSLPKRFVTSKIIIDATRQLPAEGGPKSFPPLNRNLLKDMAPQSFEIVEGKWSEYLKDFGK